MSYDQYPRKTKMTILLIFGPVAIIMLSMLAIVFWNLDHTDTEIPNSVNAGSSLMPTK